VTELSAESGIAIPEAAITRSRRRRAGQLVFLLADLLAAQGGILVASSVLQLLGSSAIAGPWSVPIATAVALSVLGPASLLGLYDHAITRALDRLRLRVYVAATLPFTSAALLALMQPLTASTVQMIAITAAVYVPLGMSAEAAVRSILFCRLDWSARVLVVGSGASAQRIVQELCARPEMGLRPVGYCGEAPEGGVMAQLPRLGSMADAANLGGAAEVAVLTLSSEQSITDPANLPFERVVLLLGTECLPVRGTQSNASGWITDVRWYRALKRLLDLLISVPLLLLSLPLMLICAVAIWCVSPGPIFYAQTRVGWRGRPVTIYKLRSMWPDAVARLETLLQTNAAAREEWQKYVKLSADPRIVPVVGAFIRRTSLDELPQLWNVIRGDISLVGPRPFPSYHVERFSPEFQRLRSSVRPGLTGLWQVTVRNSADLRQQQIIDTFYVRNQSLWLDLYIILLTLPAVLSARGAN
jgi:lipopolysaccharide/colanic/teichoic acid biosynthesis glycosyltransferase